jgi:polyisoprenoid-binding protein YceI
MIEPRRMRREGRTPGAASDDRDRPLPHARSLAWIGLALFATASTACSSIPQSQIGIESGELMMSFRSTVPRFRGFITSNPRCLVASLGGGRCASPERAVVDVDLRSLHNDSRVVAAIIQEQYLEVDRYPIAHIDVSIAGGKARGTLELHGVRRAIEFPVIVDRSPSKVRIRSAFTLKRHDFGIVRVGGWDWIARENVAIDFDLVAAPERVSVEEVPSSGRHRVDREIEHSSRARG